MGRRIRHISKEQLELLEDGADAATLEKLERGSIRKRRAVCANRDIQVEYRGKRKVRRQPRKRKHRTG